jgi:mannan endo-1,4-beta-mannosidase
MKFTRKFLYLSILYFFCIPKSPVSAKDLIKPANPRASSEAKALLEFFYDISGKYTLTGQHNYPNTKSRNSQFTSKYLGKTPVIFSADWGFAKEGDKDAITARQDIVEEVKRQHRLGSIITVCWHAVPPTADEPVTFRPPENAPPDSLMSVQGQLLDRQFKDVLTRGTKLYKRWCAQVDTIAKYLMQLKNAHIPVLWRPYHEMNGNWFWWGGRTGDNGTSELYRQLFDRLVNYHKLNNLIWVWSVDRPVKPEMRFSEFYPGNEFLDILALDVYGKDFNQSYYDSLVALSKGKPILLAEVGNPPTVEILSSQPKWSAYIIWAGSVRSTLKKQHLELINESHLLCLEDTIYQNMIAPFRAICNLPSLALRKSKLENIKPDFSGQWLFNEEFSNMDRYGASNLPYTMKIVQTDSNLIVQKTFIIEYDDDRLTTDTLVLNGAESKSVIANFPRIMKAGWVKSLDTLLIETKSIFNRSGQTVDMTTSEYWTLENEGTMLFVQLFSSGPWGDRKITMMFNKK